MKKLFLPLTLAAAFFAFTACSSDDDSSSTGDCVVCQLDLFGQMVSTEYCDNGDGTITIDGEETEDLDGISFSDFISTQESFLGADCN